MDGLFYFMTDDYFIKFPDKELLHNKEPTAVSSGKRPAFFSFADQFYPDIFWMVPFTSSIEKHKETYHYNMSKHKKCDIIHFSHVLGYEKAFVIHKMFPVTVKYIQEKYVHNNADVVIKKSDRNEIIRKSRHVLNLHRRNVKLIGPNIDYIMKELLLELGKPFP